MAKIQNFQDSTLFLTKSDDRQPVKPSSVALKAIAKAPLNMAIYDDNGLPHEVLGHVINLIRQSYQTYQNQWSWIVDLNDKADTMYWMEMKECRMPELTRAKVSASVFHRVVRRLADGAYLATFSEEMPVKFFPDIGIFDSPEEKQGKAVIADGLNRIALYYMKKSDLKNKAKKSFLNVYKYGNHIVYVPYEYEVSKKRSYQTHDMNEMVSASDGSVVYKHSNSGEISNQPHPPEMFEVEQDVVTKDWVGYYPVDIDKIMLDNRIEDVDRQSVLFWRSDINGPELFAQAKTGIFKNIEMISRLQQFQIYNWQNQAANDRITNAGKTTTDSFSSEMYEHWQVWMLLPKIETKVNSKGEVTDMTWDQNAERIRYVVDIIGDVAGNSVITRFSESPYWGNGVPFISAHSHEDDSGWYHRGLVALLEDNMLQEQVAKGQLMDNRALMMFRPMIRRVGMVKNKDMRITHNTVFDVLQPDALKWMEIPDFTANLNNSITFLKTDSESIAQVPPFFLGEALGGRTSATEFASIRDQSSAPALNDIKNLNMQIMGAWMKKVKEYIPQFLDRKVAVEVAGDNGQQMLVELQAEDFKADMSVEEYAVQEFQNKATMQQIMINLVQVVGNPVFAPYIMTAGFLERFFQQFNSIFPNPEEIIRKDPEVIAQIQAYLHQTAMQQIAEQGGVPPVNSPQALAQGGGQPQGNGVPPGIQGMPIALRAQNQPDAHAMMSTGGQARGM